MEKLGSYPGLPLSKRQTLTVGTSRVKNFYGFPSFQSISSVQFSSVAQSCLTLCDPMNRSTPGLPVHHQLPESTQYSGGQLVPPSRAYQMAQRLKCLPAMWEIWVQSLGWEDPLEKEMATLFSILAWRIPWTEEPGGLQSRGSQRVGHN